MKRALQEHLFVKYPHLFSGRTQSTKVSLMSFGITCGDGWYDIIDRLCARVELLDPDAVLVQVKEKFGGLRFYLNATKNEQVWEEIGKAERSSMETCENCGKPAAHGSDKETGWIWTVCSEECKEKLRSSYE